MAPSGASASGGWDGFTAVAPVNRGGWEGCVMRRTRSDDRWAWVMMAVVLMYVGAHVVLAVMRGWPY